MSEVQRCSRCGEVVLYVLTHGGHRRGLNPDPHPDGVVVIERSGDVIRGRVLTGDELPAQVTAYVPHDRTCARSPEAARLRAVTTPKCRACIGTPWERLDRVWAAAGHAYHVLCAPPGDFREHVARHRPAAPATAGPEQQELTA